MALPEDFIERVRDSADIVDVVSQRVNLRKAGKDYVALCPFHNEKTPSFTVSTAKQFYHCFGCGAHGNSIGFLVEYDGMSFPDAVEKLAFSAGIPMPPKGEITHEEKQRQSKEQELLSVLENARQHFCSALRDSSIAIEYAKKRGMTGSIAKHFSLGFAPGNEIAQLFENVPTEVLVEAGLLTVNDETGELRDKFWQRVMFPIQDDKGRVIGFGGRVIGEGKPKYLNSPESSVFRKGQELYGIFQSKQAIRQARSAVLLEGYMDVVMLHQYGEERAVAALGTSLTEDQVRKLFRMADEIIFCFDGDQAGQKAAARAAWIVLGELLDGKSARFVTLSEEHDPDSFVRAHGIDGWHRLLEEEGVPLSAKLIEILIAGRDQRLPEVRAAMAKEAEELIGSITQAPLFRKALVQHIEGIVGFPLEHLTTMPEQQKAKSGAAAKRSAASAPASARANREEGIRPQPGKQQFYTNLAKLCALDAAAIERLPQDLLDTYATIITKWFSLAPNESPDERLERLCNLPESVLRSFLHLGLQCAQEVCPQGEEAVEREVSALLEAFGRILDREKKRDGFDALFGG